MTGQASDHRFSPFALDQYWIEGAASNPELQRHLGTCTRCSAYLAELGGLSGQVAPVVVPAWAPPAPAARARRSSNGWRAGWLFTSFAAAAALALFIGRGRNDSYVGEKGGASAQLLIKSAGEARVWDGVRPIRAGDAVAVRVACARFLRVAVLTRSSSHEPWSAPAELECPGGDGLLPFTLVADGAGDEEQIGVVLSRVKLDGPALSRSLADEVRTDSLAAFHFRLPK